MYTLEELARMGYQTGTGPTGEAPAAPAPTAPTVAAPIVAAGAPGQSNLTWLILGGLLLVAVIAFSD
jgi:hypothetical protein